MLENNYFGEVSVTERMRREFEDLQEEYGNRVPADAMFEVVKKYQADDPANPKKDLPREIRLAVADALGVSEDNLDDVKFYSAVGTPVDHLLGVDAWVEYYDRVSRSVGRGTLDVSQREEKIQEGHKADVVFGELSDINSDEYLEEVDEIGRTLARRILAELGNRGVRVA